ncbi:MAG TPA: hypothetical protein VF828_02250 [Patescibacteria group bacterium]
MTERVSQSRKTAMPSSEELLRLTARNKRELAELQRNINDLNRLSRQSGKRTGESPKRNPGQTPERLPQARPRQNVEKIQRQNRREHESALRRKAMVLLSLSGVVSTIIIINFLMGSGKVEASGNQTVERAAVTATMSPIKPAEAAVQPGNLRGGMTLPDIQRRCPNTWDTYYPDEVMQWCPMVEEFAARDGLDPNRELAKILIESNGNPEAESNQGAKGLRQEMTRDGAAGTKMCTNGLCFNSCKTNPPDIYQSDLSCRPTLAEMADPKTNLDYSSWHQKKLVEIIGNEFNAYVSYGPANYGNRYAQEIWRLAGDCKKSTDLCHSTLK